MSSLSPWGMQGLYSHTWAVPSCPVAWVVQVWPLDDAAAGGGVGREQTTPGGGERALCTLSAPFKMAPAVPVLGHIPGAGGPCLRLSGVLAGVRGESQTRQAVVSRS